MREFYDPVTIGIAVAGLNLISGIQQGQAARTEAEATAQHLEFEAEQEEKQIGREVRDLEREKSANIARALAVAAAGGTAGFGTSLALQVGQRAAFDVQKTRILDDSAARQSGLRVRASNERSFGRARQSSAIIGGASRAAGTASRLDFSPGNNTPRRSVFGGPGSGGGE